MRFGGLQVPVVGPETLAVMREAYASAWSEVEPSIGSNSLLIHGAQEVLKKIILSCPTASLVSAYELTRVALREFDQQYFGINSDVRN